MIKRILRLWWLMLAWIVAVAGNNFWNLNAGEWFATVAIIAGVGWAIRGHFKERSRRNRLISFPDTWTATRMLSKESFEVHARVDVLIPYHSYHISLRVWEAGKPLKMEKIETEQVMGGTRGGLTVTGNTPLALVGNNTGEVEVAIQVTLDGDIRKKSKKRIIPITSAGVAPSTPDKEDSPTG